MKYIAYLVATARTLIGVNASTWNSRPSSSVKNPGTVNSISIGMLDARAAHTSSASKNCRAGNAGIAQGSDDSPVQREVGRRVGDRELEGFARGERSGFRGLYGVNTPESSTHDQLLRLIHLLHLWEAAGSLHEVCYDMSRGITSRLVTYAAFLPHTRKPYFLSTPSTAYGMR